MTGLRDRAWQRLCIAMCTLALAASCSNDDADPPSEHEELCSPGPAPSPVHDAASASGGRDAPAPIIMPPACDDAARVTYGPLLGALTDRSVKVWAKSDQPGAFSVVLWPEGEPDQLRAIEAPPFALPDNDYSVALIDGLEPDTRYGYKLQHDDCACPPSYSFKTLPARGAPARIRFATAGDVESADIPGFAEIDAIEPAFVLMVGDNVYADGFGKEVDPYRRRYEEVWGGEQFRELFAHRPAFMIWDDHELVDNYWKGKNDAVYAFARPLYDEYQGSHNPDPLVDGELYYTFEAGDIGFFVLDTRSHRSRNADPDGPEKTMLGSEQKQSLLAWLTANEHRVHVIVSSVLMSDFSTTGSDSWTAFAAEREEILGAIAAEGTNHVIVISGDQHWSAIMRLDRGDQPYSIYELQATPIGFNERVAPMETDDRVLALDNTHQVFSIFDIDTRTSPPTIDYTLCAVGQACRPHDEPGPVTSGSSTTVPYTVGFEGRDSGFELVSGL